MTHLEEQFIEDIFQEKIESLSTYLKLGRSINFILKDTTPLLTAIETENNEIVKLLLKSGADPNLITNYASPLTAAIDVAVEAYKNDRNIPFPSTEIIELLVTFGADFNLADNNGQTAYEFAQNYHLPAQRFFDQIRDAKE